MAHVANASLVKIISIGKHLSLLCTKQLDAVGVFMYSPLIRSAHVMSMSLTPMATIPKDLVKITPSIDSHV